MRKEITKCDKHGALDIEKLRQTLRIVLFFFEKEKIINSNQIKTPQ